LIARPKQTTNKQITIVHFSCHERKEKKHKQLIINDNPTIISLHVPYHMEESMSAYLSRECMARFNY
jgi:hypothetical protein